MKRNGGIGWITIEAVGTFLLVLDLWTGKLPIDRWLKIVLASAIGGMLLFGVLRRYAQKERERTRLPKKTE